MDNDMYKYCKQATAKKEAQQHQNNKQRLFNNLSPTRVYII